MLRLRFKSLTPGQTIGWVWGCVALGVFFGWLGLHVHAFDEDVRPLGLTFFTFWWLVCCVGLRVQLRDNPDAPAEAIFRSAWQQSPTVRRLKALFR